MAGCALLILCLQSWYLFTVKQRQEAERRLTHSEWGLVCENLLLLKIRSCNEHNPGLQTEMRPLWQKLAELRELFCIKGGEPEKVNFWALHGETWDLYHRITVGNSEDSLR